jgi:hypothetical protein
MKLTKKKLALFALVLGFIAMFVGGIGLANAASSLPGQVGQLAGCINQTTHTVENARGNANNLTSCPKGDVPFAVSAGKNGVNGTNGADGANGLTGAYYAVAKYDVGDTNGGAVATVKCKEPTDVAISGGVQTLALGTNGLADNVPVSSSFVGTMDWATNTPVAGSLSGWIVQFGGNSSQTSLGDPKYVDLYALCVPGASIPVDTTYAESAS